MPLEVVLECLSTREHRVSIDLVRDEVETELKKVIMYVQTFTCKLMILTLFL